jgi:hypothetical protein
MAATLSITLNTGGTATFDNVFVDAYNCEPQYAGDTTTVYAQKITVRGTAIISAGASNYTNFLAGLKNGSGRCNAITLTAGGQTLVTATGGATPTDTRGWPTASIEATEIVGTQTALLRFEVTHHQAFNADNTVSAHRWRQTMSVDAAGKVTRATNGVLHINRATSGTITTLATNGSWNKKAAYADLFRNAIIPAVPGAGWRRESQEFAVDEQGTMLTYSFVDKRHTHDLPDGVLVGNTNCTYERTAQNNGFAMVTFTADLEGSQDLKNVLTTTTGNRKLVLAAVQLAKTRIDLSYKKAWVQRIRVEERDIMSGYAIRFELEAMVQAKSADNGDGTSILPIAYMVGNEFTITRTETRAAKAYGNAINVGTNPTQYGMMPTYIDNLVDGMSDAGGNDKMPVASLFTITDANAYGSVTVAVISNANGVTLMNTDLGGRFANTELQPTADADGFARMVMNTSSFTISKYESGLVKMSPMYVGASELVFQTRKPVVYVRERTEVARMNQAPPKALRPMPADAFVVGEDWRVSFGKFDAQGNRNMSGVFERELAMYDDGGSAGGFSTETVGGISIRKWNAPNDFVMPTLSPVATTDSQQSTGSVFVNPSDTKIAFAVPSQAFIT